MIIENTTMDKIQLYDYEAISLFICKKFNLGISRNLSRIALWSVCKQSNISVSFLSISMYIECFLSQEINTTKSDFSCKRNVIDITFMSNDCLIRVKSKQTTKFNTVFLDILRIYSSFINKKSLSSYK